MYSDPPDRHSLGGGCCQGETRAEEAQRRRPGPSQDEATLVLKCAGWVGVITRRRRGKDSRQREEEDKAGQNGGRR